VPIIRDKWVPCNPNMPRPQVADGGNDLQIRKVSSNTLDKQSRRAERSGPPDWTGRGAIKSL
jgi:hypothetical protein